MLSKDVKNQFPVFFKTSEYLANKANFFKRSLPRLFDDNYNFKLAERVCKTALNISDNNWNSYYENLDNLIELSLDFLKLQVKLENTGRYPYSTFKEIEKNAYSGTGSQTGPNYLWGLYFSEVFWKIHHNFTHFFLENFASGNKENGNVLEVPVGTGFFLSEFLRQNPNWYGTGIDLSERAIHFSKNVLSSNSIPEDSYRIIKHNFFEYQTTEEYERIICGEFLEHLEDPLEALKKLNSLLTDNARIFLTVAIWAAGIDHIYLYTRPSEVRQHIEMAGLKIEKEFVQPVFEKDSDNLEKGKIALSYTAILSK